MGTLTSFLKENSSCLKESVKENWSGKKKNIFGNLPIEAREPGNSPTVNVKPLDPVNTKEGK